LLEMKINFAVFQFGLGLKRFLRKKAPTRELRSKRLMKRCFTYIGNGWVSLKEQDAKKELCQFLRFQAEVGAIRDSIARYGSAVNKIQVQYQKWKKSQDNMITQITQLWIEERDKIVAHCMKKSSK